MPQELGERIRALRKEMGLSLEGLAEKSGVALATLSRMENGKGGGTFRTHQRIAEALHLSLPEMYRELVPSEEEGVLAAPKPEEAETFAYDEKASAVFLVQRIASKNMLPQLLMLKPGGKTTLEQYRKGTERWIFGLEGAVEIAVGEKNYRVPKGGTLYFRASLPHRLINSGRATAKIISVTSPATL